MQSINYEIRLTENGQTYTYRVRTLPTGIEIIERIHPKPHCFSNLDPKRTPLAMPPEQWKDCQYWTPYAAQTAIWQFGQQYPHHMAAWFETIIQSTPHNDVVLHTFLYWFTTYPQYVSGQTVKRWTHTIIASERNEYYTLCALKGKTTRPVLKKLAEQHDSLVYAVTQPLLYFVPFLISDGICLKQPSSELITMVTMMNPEEHNVGINRLCAVLRRTHIPRPKKLLILQTGWQTFLQAPLVSHERYLSQTTHPESGFHDFRNYVLQHIDTHTPPFGDKNALAIAKQIFQQ